MARSYLALFTYLLNSAVVGREYSDLGLHVNGWMRYLARPDERKLCVCVCVCVFVSRRSGGLAGYNRARLLPPGGRVDAA